MRKCQPPEIGLPRDAVSRLITWAPEGTMRFAPILLLASAAALTATAAKKDLLWFPATLNAVTSDEWCKVMPGMPGTCDSLFDVPIQFTGPDAGVIGQVPPVQAPASGAPIAHPVTQIFKLDGPTATYIVKYVTYEGLRFPPQSPAECALEGKHLLLRVSGKKYKTDILAIKKR